MDQWQGELSGDAVTAVFNYVSLGGPNHDLRQRDERSDEVMSNDSSIIISSAIFTQNRTVEASQTLSDTSSSMMMEEDVICTNHPSVRSARSGAAMDLNVFRHGASPTSRKAFITVSCHPPRIRGGALCGLGAVLISP